MAIDGLNFTPNKIQVALSSGPTYPKIYLTAHEFSTSNAEDLALDYVGTDEKCHKFTRSYAPPWALYKVDRKTLKEVCFKHVKGIINLERDIGEATMGDTSMLSWEVFEALNRYRRLN